MTDWRRDATERSADAVARWRRRPGGDYAPICCHGTQRPPRHADELGALCVIETDTERVIVRADANREWVRLETKPRMA